MGKNKRDSPAERIELSREHIELQDGKMCDLVAYNVQDYGYVEYAENIELSNGEFRRARSLMPFNYLDASMQKFNWNLYDQNVNMQKRVVESFISQFDEYQKAGKGLYIFPEQKEAVKHCLRAVLQMGSWNIRIYA